MARIRTIKPEFFLDDELAELPIVSRMLFIGLWTLCDCEGRLEDRPKRIKAQILPFDDCDVSAALDGLHEAGFVVRYESAGGKYISVPNFRKHQRLSGIEAQSRSAIPPPERAKEAQEIAIEAIEKQSRSNEEAASVQEGKGRERKGKDVNPSGAPNESADKSSQISGPATPMPAEVDSPAIDGELLPAPKPQPPAKQQRDESTSAEQEACRATWAAYADAYEQRYGVAPIRNAKVNAAIKGFTRRVGADESPGVARYYLQHQDAFYARKCHDAGLMQQDAEKLRTEWATQRQVTGVAARQQERAGTMLNAVDRILAKREAAA